jgi:succinate-semialdehyde dehydrogenase / glutarate-semialdehyde dehydrogenase
MSEYAVVNPATGETVARYDTFTDAQVEEALAAAAAAFETWRKVPVAERARMVRRAAELHRERRKDLAAIIVREMGKPFGAAVGEADFAADITQYYADQADVITADQPLTILGEGTAVIRRSPLGVLFGIMPWNFPYYQVARFAAPNGLPLSRTMMAASSFRRSRWSSAARRTIRARSATETFRQVSNAAAAAARASSTWASVKLS